MADVEPSKVFDIKGILKAQCNRFPMLFIDKVTDCIPGERAVAQKNFTYNEWFFPPHYEDDPNVPGFVLVESLVQAFLMTFLSLPEHFGSRTNFLEIKNTAFRRRVVPGDTLVITATLTSFKRGVARGEAVGRIDGALAVSGEFVVGLPSILDKFKPQ
ncbi:MAG: 3-hydroxyacyl-ACP dehydratase FabZ family protein [Pseudomonadota bacterium]